MIIMGRKKGSHSVVSAIREKMSGKGMSDEDLKYDHEKYKKDDSDPSMELEHAAHGIMEAMKANDVKNMEHALKSFIELCLKNKEY